MLTEAASLQLARSVQELASLQLFKQRVTDWTSLSWNVSLEHATSSFKLVGSVGLFLRED